MKTKPPRSLAARNNTWEKPRLIFEFGGHGRVMYSKPLEYTQGAPSFWLVVVSGLSGLDLTFGPYTPYDEDRITVRLLVRIKRILALNAHKIGLGTAHYLQQCITKELAYMANKQETKP